MDLLRHPGFNNSLDTGDIVHGSNYTDGGHISSAKQKSNIFLFNLLVQNGEDCVRLQRNYLDLYEYAKNALF